MRRKEVRITGDVIIQAAALTTACGGLLTLLLTGHRFFLRQKRQDKELTAIREELTLLCYGVMSCLDGLRQQGCNHHVTQALDKLDRHLNLAAHKGED